jgi:hypothetical protein
MDEGIKGLIVVMLSILLFTSILATSIIMYQKNKIQNFQNTIKDLSDEQKCIHICGFEFGGYLDQYKFCLEKCDRISEREKTVRS